MKGGKARVRGGRFALTAPPRNDTPAAGQRGEGLQHALALPGVGEGVPSS